MYAYYIIPLENNAPHIHNNIVTMTWHLYKIPINIFLFVILSLLLIPIPLPYLYFILQTVPIFPLPL